MVISAASLCGKESRQSVIKSLEEKMANEKNPLVLMKTNMGDIVIELYNDAAPETVKNFIDLASGEKEFLDPKSNRNVKKPYFDGLSFHRVIPNFMIQGGDILGTGAGGPGYKFKDEINADALGLNTMKIKDAQGFNNDAAMYVFQKLNITSREEQQKRMKEIEAEYEKVLNMNVKDLLTAKGYVYDSNLPSVPVKKYTLAMANAGPNTNGSQFFINVVDNFFLNGKHTVFGKVVKGQAVCEKISTVERDNRDKPKNPVIMTEVRVLK